jgi:hypothetical protein
MKTTTQPNQPIELPQLPTFIDTPTEILIYVTLLLTLSTNTLKSVNNLTTELKKLKKQWRSQKTKPKKRK